MRSDCIFFHTLPVRYGEIDRQGIVYNPIYIIYTDEAFNAFMQSKGYTYEQLSTQYDSEVCHKKTTIEYHASAYADDVLDIGVRVGRIGERSFTLIFEIYRHNTQELLVTSESVFVGYDLPNRRSCPISDTWRTILST